MFHLRLVVLLSIGAVPLAAQEHVHRPEADPGLPQPRALTAAGQSAFQAVAEVVAVLSADSSTDWSRVDIEALRQHLIDMDLVLIQSTVMARNVDGGVRLLVRGPGRVGAAIRRMVGAHAQVLDAMPGYRASAKPTPGGIDLVVTARNPSDQRSIARIRGLGLAGLLTEGSHHPRHHLMIARGEPGAHRQPSPD